MRATGTSRIVAVALLAWALVGSCGGAAGLGAGGSDGQEEAASGVYTRYATADAIIVKVCAGCHARAGAHPDQPRAHLVLPLDGYDDWRRGATVIAAVIDDARPDGNPMPPASAPAQPSAGERQLLLDWTRRGSPDTPDGR